MTPGETYLQKSRGLVDAVEAQLPAIRQTADWFAATILAGRMVHVFASGHSRIMVEEMWPRYGSFPGFNPIVELSLTFHNLVVGANGQRQAMFLENVGGLAERILRNFDLSDRDAALVISSSGCNVVPIEMAELFRRRGMKVAAIVSRRHSEASRSNDPRGKKVQDFADVVLDTGAPPGDAMVAIDGLETPVSPGSTVGGCLLVNAIKAEVADRLTKAGRPPTVLTGAAVVGAERARELFEAAYDEHARRLAELYRTLGRHETDGKGAVSDDPRHFPDGGEVQIRRLSDGDSLAELTDLLHRSYARLAAMGLHFLATAQGVDVTARRVRKGECYVGVAGGRLVATVTFRPAAMTYDSPWLDRPDVCSFQQFAVDPPLQGRGIGRRLIAVCERRAAETGAAELALDTAEPAGHLIRLYERLGFRFIEYARWPDVNYRSVIMSKAVGLAIDATQG